MMKRVAIPITDGKLSEYFGHCNFYEIYDIQNNSIVKNTVEKPKVHDIKDLPDWASSNGITDIITYKLSNQIITLFSKYKINLYVGITVDNPEKLIEKFLDEELISDDRVIKQIMNN